MRAAVLFMFGLALAGCGADPCNGVAGTCVALTVQSSTVSSVDTLRIAASGALSGTHTTSAGKSTLPVQVALKLPAGVSGALHLAVDGLTAGKLVGSGNTDVTVTSGKHTTAVVTLGSQHVGDGGTGAEDLASGGGGGDGGGSDLGSSGADMMLPTPCDPNGVTAAQCVWRWQIPTPQGDSLYGITAFSDIDVFAISSRGVVAHRDANGWHLLPARPLLANNTLFEPTSGGLVSMGSDLFAVGASVSGSAPAVFRSSDKGLSWSLETLPNGATGSLSGPAAGNAFLVAVSSTANTVYVRDGSGNWSAQTATGSWSAAATNNSATILVGGSTGPTAAVWNNVSTWTPMSTGLPATGNALSGACGSAGGFWAVSGDATASQIYHWDGVNGHAWAAQTAPAGTHYLAGCYAKDSAHVYAWGGGGSTLVYTIDGGTTWMNLPMTPNTVIFAGTSSSTAYYFAGIGGDIYRSADGTTMVNEAMSLPQGQRPSIASIHGVAPRTLFAVGTGGLILKTTDDGNHWTLLAQPQAGGMSSTIDLVGVWGASPTDVYAISKTTISHSSDGTSFQVYGGATIPNSAQLTAIWGSALGVYAVGTSTGGNVPAVYRTTDHGATWNAIAVAGFTTGTISSVFATDTAAWLTGFDNAGHGVIYYAPDGTTFANQTPLPNLPAGTPIGEIRGAMGELWTTTETSSGLYHSTGGATAASWTFNATAFPNSGTVNALTVAPDLSVLFALDNNGAGYYQSTDKGAHWASVGVPADEFYVSATFAFGANDIFVAGSRGIVHYGN